MQRKTPFWLPVLPELSAGKGCGRRRGAGRLFHDSMGPVCPGGACFRNGRWIEMRRDAHHLWGGRLIAPSGA